MAVFAELTQVNDRVISFIIEKLIGDHQMIDIFGQVSSNIQFFALNFGFVFEETWNRVDEAQRINCTNDVAKRSADRRRVVVYLIDFVSSYQARFELYV